MLRWLGFSETMELLPSDPKPATKAKNPRLAPRAAFSRGFESPQVLLFQRGIYYLVKAHSAAPRVYPVRRSPYRDGLVRVAFGTGGGTGQLLGLMRPKRILVRSMPRFGDSGSGLLATSREWTSRTWRSNASFIFSSHAVLSGLW